MRYDRPAGRARKFVQEEGHHRFHAREAPALPRVRILQAEMPPIGRDPADFDLCWDIAMVDLEALAQREPALDPLRPDRRALRLRYGGDLFFVLEPLGVGLLEDFQHDREGRRKGIILLELTQ